MALFESYDRRIDHINAVLNEYGINGIEDAKAICDAKGIDPYTMCKETQPICFENACWAYVVGAAINDLQEKFAHCCIDSVTNKVSVQCFEYCLARKDFGSHSS